MATHIDEYDRKFSRDLILRAKQAVTDDDDDLALELLDCLQAMFCASKAEVYELRPDTGAHETGPDAA